MTAFSLVDNSRLRAQVLQRQVFAPRVIARHAIDLLELSRRLRAAVNQALLVAWMLLALAAWLLLLVGFAA